MNWFLIALITPIAHAAVNHIDKNLIAKYFRGGDVGSLVLFSALFAVVGLPIIAFFDRTIFMISKADAVLLMINGIILVFAYIFYFHALLKDEASYVAPLFQLVPVFGFILGYLFLGETLLPIEVAGSITIILGAVILSLELGDTGISLKKKIIFLMAASSLLYAINAVLFKFVAEDQQRFLPALFWDFAGKVIGGILIFLLVKSYRRQFLTVLRENSKSILALNGLNEVLAVVGEAALVFAVLLAPVALVQVVSGFQPLFVFVFGVVLTLTFPHLAQESLRAKHLTQKLLGIAVIILGTVILSLSPQV